jgi:hypothetical protein
MPLLVGLGLLTASLSLLVFAYLGTFSRYYADDYCMSGLVARLGFWKAQEVQYVSWSNRFSGMLTLSIADLLSRDFIRLWPGLALLAWAAGLAWCLSQLGRLLELRVSRWVWLLLAEWVVFTSLLLTPQLYQSLFWRVGVITYVLPLALLGVLAGSLLRAAGQRLPPARAWQGFALTGFLAFLGGGFSETYLTLQISVVTIGLAAVLLSRRKSVRRSWLGGLAAAEIGTILAAAAVLLSPGNAVRQGMMPAAPGVLTLARLTAENTLIFLHATLKNNLVASGAAVLAPMLLFYGLTTAGQPPIRRRPAAWTAVFLSIPGLTCLLTAALMAPAAYAQSSYPDGRVLVIASFLLSLALAAEGSVLGALIGQLQLWAGEKQPGYTRALSAAMLALALLLPLNQARKSWAQLPEFRQAAATWDRRDAVLRQAAALNTVTVTVSGLNAPGGLADFAFDPSSWVNVCAAQFYGVQKIAVQSP